MSELYPNADPTDIRSNQFYAINGLLSSSPKDLILRKEEATEWHILGWGTYTDLKNMRWEGSQIKLYDQVVDFVGLMPASFYTVTVTPPKKQGVFKFGAFEYEKDGMFMAYTVK